jgi:hypothetical protein
MLASTAKRKLAELFSLAGSGDLFVAPMGKTMRYDRYLALMLWDAVTAGEFYFADGTIMRVGDFKEWLDLVKFMTNHMDGPALLEQNNLTQVNVYKIYTGIDDSRL